MTGNDVTAEDLSPLARYWKALRQAEQAMPWAALTHPTRRQPAELPLSQTVPGQPEVEDALRGATVSTDQADYAPGAIVTITASGFTPGSTITCSIADLPSDRGDDGGQPDVYAPFAVMDGGAGDLDGQANGVVVAQWTVPTDNNGTGTGIPDALNATLQLVAVGSDGKVAITEFTDSVPTDAPVNLTALGQTGQLNGAFFSNAEYKGGT